MRAMIQFWILVALAIIATKLADICEAIKSLQ